eukprot:2497300-Amphidinium_carterae.2
MRHRGTLSPNTVCTAENNQIPILSSAHTVHSSAIGCSTGTYATATGKPHMRGTGNNHTTDHWIWRKGLRG